MSTVTQLHTGAVSVLDYRCTAGPADAPFPEWHRRFSISYVRRGSFGYHSGGRSHALVAGAVLVGQPEHEFLCTHDHHDGGDECLSFHFPPEAAAPLVDAAVRRAAGVSPLRFRRLARGERKILQERFAPPRAR